MKITKVKTKEINYTNKLEGVEECPKCKRMAKVIDNGGSDYIYYQHSITKAYGNGTLLNTYSNDECRVLA